MRQRDFGSSSKQMLALDRERTIQMGWKVTGINLHRNAATSEMRQGDEMEGETVSKMPQELSVQTPTLSDVFGFRQDIWPRFHLLCSGPTTYPAYFPGWL